MSCIIIFSSIFSSNLTGHENVTKLLIDNKADVNTEDYLENTPLRLAAMFGNFQQFEVW